MHSFVLMLSFPMMYLVGKMVLVVVYTDVLPLCPYSWRSVRVITKSLMRHSHYLSVQKVKFGKVKCRLKFRRGEGLQDRCLWHGRRCKACANWTSPPIG